MIFFKNTLAFIYICRNFLFCSHILFTCWSFVSLYWYKHQCQRIWSGAAQNQIIFLPIQNKYAHKLSWICAFNKRSTKISAKVHRVPSNLIIFIHIIFHGNRKKFVWNLSTILFNNFRSLLTLFWLHSIPYCRRFEKKHAHIQADRQTDSHTVLNSVRRRLIQFSQTAHFIDSTNYLQYV